MLRMCGRTHKRMMLTFAFFRAVQLFYELVATYKVLSMLLSQPLFNLFCSRTEVLVCS